MSDTSMSDTELGLDSAEECEHCGDVIVTTVKLDPYIRLTKYMTDGYEVVYYCDLHCVACDVDTEVDQ